MLLSQGQGCLRTACPSVFLSRMLRRLRVPWLLFSKRGCAQVGRPGGQHEPQSTQRQCLTERPFPRRLQDLGGFLRHHGDGPDCGLLVDVAVGRAVGDDDQAMFLQGRGDSVSQKSPQGSRRQQHGGPVTTHACRGGPWPAPALQTDSHPGSGRVSFRGGEDRAAGGAAKRRGAHVPLPPPPLPSGWPAPPGAHPARS